MDLNLETLRESNDFIQMVLSSIPSAVFVAGSSMEILCFNEPMAEFSGSSSEKNQGDYCGAVLNCASVQNGQQCGEGEPCAGCNLRSALAWSIDHNEAVTNQMCSMELQENGITRTKYLRFTIRPLLYQGKQVALVVMDDVTELESGRKELQHLYSILEQKSYLDILTGLSNRRMMQSLMEKEEGRRKRSGGFYSVVVLDIDDFKKINDSHGHSAGDEVLVQLADILMAKLRLSDTPARFGGEEFVLLLPDTDLKGAMECAEIVRASLESAFVGSYVGKVTASFGVASSYEAESIKDLMNMADMRLYEAKRSGKNRVVGQ